MWYLMADKMFCYLILLFKATEVKENKSHKTVQPLFVLCPCGSQVLANYDRQFQREASSTCKTACTLYYNFTSLSYMIV